MLCSLTPNILHAQVRPYGHWHQIESSHFRAIYSEGLDSLARSAIQRAELEHARLSAGLVRAPKGKIDIIVDDNTDITNGYATPFPSNRIVLFARPPVEELSLQYYEDWMQLVITHELTHIFHMEQAGKFGRLARSIFGRVPAGWPVFPIAELPRWNLEGLAVLIESEHTGAGRIYGSFHEMVVRTDLLEGRFQTIDRMSGETPIWPGGARAYIYGSLFTDYIARTYGDSAHTPLIKKAAGSVLPPVWRMDGVAKGAMGKSYSTLYKEWEKDLERRYRPLADSIAARGITQTERISKEGRRAWFARVSPDGKRVAYADENGKDIVATRVIDLATGEDRRMRRNWLGPLAWLPDGSGFITAQYEEKNEYETYSDLYEVKDGRETRLTYNERIETPDLSRDGRQLVYMQNVAGSNRLAVRDMASGQTHVVAERTPDVQWIMPRFSPDGNRIAVQRWQRANGIDVVVFENGRVVREIDTGGTDGAPAWSPDGSYILFSSDATGISNIYASDGERILQVTNVIGGAFYPDVSPDGRWIYFSNYHADGFHIERMPFDPARWQPASAGTDTRRAIAAPVVQFDSTHLSTPQRYSPVKSGLPHFWLPVEFGESKLGTFYGVFTLGMDDLDRHFYIGQIAYDFEHDRTAGDLTYTYAGLGNPVINVQTAREWDYTGLVNARDAAGTATSYGSYDLENRLSVDATFSRARWRSGSSVRVGVERVQLTHGILGPAAFTDPKDRLLGVFAGVGYGNTRNPALAISREDGVRGSAFVRRRFDLDSNAPVDASYTELSGSSSAYKSVPAGGFAHHALAIRAAGVARTGAGASPTDAGGFSDYLMVRGYDQDARIGFKAWSASLEYRVPLALIGRGYKLWPFFLDRMSMSAFADAGNASCNSAQRMIYLDCAGNAGRPMSTLMSAGAEVLANVGVLSFFPGWFRVGVGFPLRGGGSEARVYLAAGQSF